MFVFFRPVNLLVLLSYAVLTAIPFAPLLFGQVVAQPFKIAGTEFVAWLIIWAIFKRPARFHWLLAPAFLAVPVDLYLRFYYRQGISAHHLGIIVESSPKEALEFLGKEVWGLVLVLLIVVAWWWLCWKAARRTHDLDWTDKSRVAVLVWLLFGIGIWGYGYQFGIQPELSPPSTNVSLDTKQMDMATPEENPHNEEITTVAEIAAERKQPPLLSGFAPLPPWLNIPFELDAFGDTWPFGLVVHGYEFWSERAYLRELKHSSNLFTFGAYQRSAPDQAQLVIMVIGESARYDRWRLNGYHRDTSPLLSNESNLVSLSNVITAVSATRLSVPVLVSRKPAQQSLQARFAEKSFLSAFKEAGFKTYWLSNQMSFGKFDTPVSVFANEADVTQFLNLGGIKENSSYDDILIAPLEYAIKDPAKKKLIVLHTLGNHWNYSHRHPIQFNKWQPSLSGVNQPAYTDLKIKTQLNNSYDNSILYSDWFLSQVIAAAKSSNQLSSMMYVSDHGQTLYDGNCRLAFHGHNTQFEFHIPVFVWLSDSFYATYPAKVAQLKRNQHAKLTTENIFHSMLDMADIHYEAEQLQRSFFNPALVAHKRYVDSYGWSDYDNATFKGDCREVIDKGKPLAQEK